MKKFDRICIVGIFVYILAILGINIFFGHKDFSDDNREYKVALNRVEQAIFEYEEEVGNPPSNLKELYKQAGLPSYASVLSIESIPSGDINQDTAAETLYSFLEADEKDYYIIITDSNIYKITYNPNIEENQGIIIYINLILGIVLIGMMIFCIYIRHNIIKPFNTLSDMPYELAKGNMRAPLKENKNKFFGKYVWGMNMLRENIEEGKERELEMQKEKKVLLLSLSHDIKTPLSAIKLYSKALSKNLYKTEEKRQEITESISEKVDEIEGYISEIVMASREDFLSFDVSNKEFYVKDTLDEVKDYYQEKMELNKIDFNLDMKNNCLVFGDKDRLTEVIQNLVENAIKYGDGQKIDICAFKEDDEYVISVKNTGCTLDEKELPHVFDSFFRGSNVEEKKGSGLGLYICRQLTHLMEGEIVANILRDDAGDMMEVKVILKLA